MSFTKADHVVAFCLAGHATVTIQSHKTEMHYTFRIKRENRGNGIHFVSLLTGADAYSYMGIIDSRNNRRHEFMITRKSQFTDDSKSVRAFRWFWGWMVQRDTIPELLEIRHDGHCARCGRQLTTPQSIDLGLGPECAIKEGVTERPRKRQRKSEIIHEFPIMQNMPSWLG